MSVNYFQVIIMTSNQLTTELNWYVEAIKKMKYGTYKNIARRFDISVSHLWRMRKGKVKVNPKLLYRIRQSFIQLSRNNYYLLIIIFSQSSMAMGKKFQLLTKNAAIGTAQRLNNSQKTDHVYYCRIFRQGTNERFNINDFREITSIIDSIEQEGVIFIDAFGFVTELQDELTTAERDAAEDEIYNLLR